MLEPHPQYLAVAHGGVEPEGDERPCEPVLMGDSALHERFRLRGVSTVYGF